MYEPKVIHSQLPLHIIGCDHPLNALIRGTGMPRCKYFPVNETPNLAVIIGLWRIL